MKRDRISKNAFEIQRQARLSIDSTLDDSAKAKWSAIEGEAERLSNDACECRHTVKSLRARLKELFEIAGH